MIISMGLWGSQICRVWGWRQEAIVTVPVRENDGLDSVGAGQMEEGSRQAGARLQYLSSTQCSAADLLFLREAGSILRSAFSQYN